MGRALGGPGNAQAEPGLGFPRGQGWGVFAAIECPLSGDQASTVGTQEVGAEEGGNGGYSLGDSKGISKSQFPRIWGWGSGEGRWALPGLCVHLVGGWSEEGRYLPRVQNLRWC